LAAAAAAAAARAMPSAGGLRQPVLLVLTRTSRARRALRAHAAFRRSGGGRPGRLVSDAPVCCTSGCSSSCRSRALAHRVAAGQLCRAAGF